MKIILALNRIGGPEGGDTVLAVGSTVEKAKQLLGEMLVRGGSPTGKIVFHEVEVDITVAKDWWSGTVGTEIVEKKDAC